jgi:hypothetical protein
MVWGEEITEAKSLLTLVKEVKLLLPTHCLKAQEKILPLEITRRPKATSAGLIYFETLIQKLYE